MFCLNAVQRTQELVQAMQDTKMADEDGNAGGNNEDDKANEAMGTTHGKNLIVVVDNEDNTGGVEQMMLEVTAGGSADVAEPVPNPQ